MATVLLLGFGAWRYVTTGSQWLWLCIQLPSAMPTMVAVALGMKTEKKKETLRRIVVTEGWVAIPVLTALALAMAACIVLNTRAPSLHGVQFPCNFLVGLLQTAARDIRKRLWPMQQHPSESRESLVSRGAMEAQELENLPLEQNSNFATQGRVGGKGATHRAAQHLKCLRLHKRESIPS